MSGSSGLLMAGFRIKDEISIVKVSKYDKINSNFNFTDWTKFCSLSAFQQEPKAMA